ncbi:MAG: penicillin acylase family protein [Cyclobacteriaceae bacterium]
MKIFRFVFFFLVSIALIYFLNFPIGQIPPLGKLLSPHQGFWQNNETKPISLPVTITSDGVSKPVKVVFDELSIPHISASTDEDMYFAQGYVTAYHRLWQMDFYSRVVFGRISEVVGARAIDYDRLQRRIGLKKMTKEFHAELMKDPELSRIIRAYTAGVNAYINNLKLKDQPIEFKLLNYQPEPWTTEKSLMAYALLANTLSRSERDLENTNMFNLLGDEMYDLLFPEQLGNLSPVIPKGTQWPFEGEIPEQPDTLFPLQITPSTINKPSPLNGSNNFAATKSKTRSGNAIMANEPDLRLTLPSIWYAAHLQSQESNTMGVTVPGTPVVLIGFNDSIAWGVTNSPRDQVDWYAITFKDDQRKEYLYNNQWFKTETVIEEITVKGEPSYYDTIIYTHQGPLVYDRNFGNNNGKVNYAMRWIAHDPSSSFHAMYGITKSKNYENYKNVLRSFSGPPQNFIYADVKGNIALNLPGKFPIKWPQQGKFLMDGSDPAHEWKGYIPFDHRLNILNPATNYISSANQHPVDDLYPYYVYDHHYELYRNRRINERLSVIPQIDVTSMMKLQNDNYNYIASENLPHLLSKLDTATMSDEHWKYYSLLSQWDYFSETDLVVPSVFDFWWDNLYAMIWDEFDDLDFDGSRPNTYTTGQLLKQDSSFQYFDIEATSNVETSIDLIQQSFELSMDSIIKWDQSGTDLAWYQYKNTRIDHLISSFGSFGLEQVKIGGNRNIVNAASAQHGPSWRMVVELDPKGIKAYGVYPGSQTGNPGNINYAHMVEDWAAGNYYNLNFGAEPLTPEEIQFTLTIKPE